ncbi:MAG: VRR-NUC domain-containing protein [Bacteroidota bacterium]
MTKEDLEHIQVVNWMHANAGSSLLWFHVPSEGKKSAFERYKHSIMGNKKGVPDFLILYPKLKLSLNNKPTIEYLGLVIELKVAEYNRLVTKGKKAGKTVKTIGKLSDEQGKVLEQFKKAGYKAVCCFGAQAAIKEIEEYFKK